MPRKLLLFAALAVAGSMLALFLLTRNRSGESSASTPSNDTVAKSGSGDGEIDLRDPDRKRPELPTSGSSDETEIRPDRSRTGGPNNSDPSRPQGTTITSTPRGSATMPTEPPLEYTLPDGRRVRDFRSPDKRVPLEVPPSTHVPGGRKIQPELTGLYTDQILAHMRECGKAVPKDALGTKPRLEGQIVIAIKAGQGSVTSAVFKMTNLTNASIAETARTCVEQAALTVKVSAPGEADLDSYSINLSFAFP